MKLPKIIISRDLIRKAYSDLCGGAPTESYYVTDEYEFASNDEGAYVIECLHLQKLGTDDDEISICKRCKKRFKLKSEWVPE